MKMWRLSEVSQSWFCFTVRYADRTTTHKSLEEEENSLADCFRRFLFSPKTRYKLDST